MEDINTELEKLLLHYWEPDIKMYINNLKVSMKTYQYLITKTTKNDILELVKLANKIKEELEILILKNTEQLTIIKDKDQEIETLQKEIERLKSLLL